MTLMSLSSFFDEFWMVEMGNFHRILLHLEMVQYGKLRGSYCLVIISQCMYIACSRH